MWHPHVYGTPPKSPTPFSIDDILKQLQSTSTNPATDMPEGPKKLMPGWAHLINNFILQQQYTVFDYGANVAEIQNFYRQQAQLRYWCHMKGSCMGKFLESYCSPPFEFKNFTVSWFSKFVIYYQKIHPKIQNYSHMSQKGVKMMLISDAPLKINQMGPCSSFYKLSIWFFFKFLICPVFWH